MNLQDATRLINYDLHWNPVRLMQRIGRIDRRLNPETEAQIIDDHPDQKNIRGQVAYWNFLPPEDLDSLLKLFSRVSQKTLRISKTFGIEGRKLLTPEDDYDDLKNFIEKYEGSLSPTESMHLELQQLIRDHPDLEARLKSLPLKTFSGKANTISNARAVFFCYAMPVLEKEQRESSDTSTWSLDAGFTKWYLHDLDKDDILDEPTEIIDFIRSTPDTQRRCIIEPKTLKESREKLELLIKNSYLKKVQAPVGVKPVLKAWMELN